MNEHFRSFTEQIYLQLLARETEDLEDLPRRAISLAVHFDEVYNAALRERANPMDVRVTTIPVNSLHRRNNAAG